MSVTWSGNKDWRKGMHLDDAELDELMAEVEEEIGSEARFRSRWQLFTTGLLCCLFWGGVALVAHWFWIEAIRHPRH